MRIELPTGTSAELVVPEGEPPQRGLAIFPDIGGLRPLFDDMVARIAADQHWAVCAIEMFPGYEDKPLDWRLEHAGEVPDRRRLDDIVAAADVMPVPTVNVIGFCMGGMTTLKAAGTGRFHRAAAFYGMIRTPEKWQHDGAVEPLDQIAHRRACPTMAIIGLEDEWTPAEDVAALEAAGVRVERYAGAQHGFVHDPSRPTHRADDAADAWAKVFAFLSE